MAEKKKKKKEKTSVVLPSAWKSLKHRNETAQARTNYDDTWKAITTILLILAVLFVLLGGISQTGVLKFVFNWAHNVGETVSGWIEGGSIVTNEDGIYFDPTGQNGDKIKDEDAQEVVNPIEELENANSEAENQNEQSTDESNNQNSEVQTE